MENHPHQLVQLQTLTGPIQAIGAILPVEITLPETYVEQLTKTKQPLPEAKIGVALLDTGSSDTIIHEPFLADLPIGISHQSMYSTPGHTSKVNCYPVKLVLPTHQGHFEFKGIHTRNLENFTTSEGMQVACILGRDILRHFVFVYDGPSDTFSLRGKYSTQT